MFLQIARDLPTFRGGEAEFRSWALVITHHRLLDERRYDCRHPSEPAPGETIAARAATGDVDGLTPKVTVSDEERSVARGCPR